MRAIFDIFVRCALIVLGYGFAVLVASTMMAVMVFGFHPEGDGGPAYGFSVAMAAVVIGYWAFLPGMAVIVAGEVLRRRDWLFYALGGGTCGLALIAWRDAGFGNVEFALAVAAAGLVAGWVYWLIAGRSAALWLPPDALGE